MLCEKPTPEQQPDGSWLVTYRVGVDHDAQVFRTTASGGGPLWPTLLEQLRRGGLVDG
jgi:hypothetical protein